MLKDLQSPIVGYRNASLGGCDPCDAKADPTLASVLDRLNGVYHRSMGLATSAERVADTLHSPVTCGSMGSTGSDKAPPPEGAVVQLNKAVNAINESLDRIDAALDRAQAACG